ncbi:ATP-binding protein [Chryseobacterium paridis]|uniref:Histidine kinase/HSP90-like ATPase domain-containing protein n=1 Tax=Chryseobacterium paridis TaxID=2800328 RepID=A0ABS1FR46_9FLAO|nr:ATP-binding protein [Chryseobacterium paridis]MBK1894869.1 hypothetical protein [Chryseobacterium paridis]
MKNLNSLFFILLLAFTSCYKKELSKADRTNYDKAYNFLDASKKDSAFKYFNKAKDNFIEKGYPSYAGSSLVNMGIIQCDGGDYYGAQETALSAIKFLDEKKDAIELTSNYNNLGVSYQNMKDFNKAAYFYNEAAKFTTDSIYQMTLLNNKAVSYSHLKKYNYAISIFNELLASPNIRKHPIVFSMVYDNLAFTKFQQNINYNAEPELNVAVRIRKIIKDEGGLNASFSHLAEYFENRNPQKALSYAKEMFKIASINKSPDDKLSALQKIILLEKPENTKIYFNEYQKLKDSLEIARNKSKSQFALERFGSEQLKAQNAEKENQLLWQYLLLGALVAAVIVIIVLYNRRQKRLKHEKEIEIKNTQLKLSKKVHDVVANGIYHVMTKIENQEHFDKTEALDELEFVYEKSRDISYEKQEHKNNNNSFNDEVSHLIGSFKNERVKTYTVGNSKEIWKGLTDTTTNEIYQIIRELLVNMKKHSQADKVIFKFEKINNRINIQYTDNGIGISGDLIRNNGLTNTDSRIENINGKIIFDTKTEKGLKVNISFPVS